MTFVKHAKFTREIHHELLHQPVKAPNIFLFLERDRDSQIQRKKERREEGGRAREWTTLAISHSARGYAKK